MGIPLLLHICCGPCSIMPVRVLRDKGYEPVGWFMNPNIQPLSEYLRRREATGECAERLNLEMTYDDRWDLAGWLEMQHPYWHTGQRCENCCAMRLEAAAKAASAMGVLYFSTSLLYSRYQPHDFIRKRGTEIGNVAGLTFVYMDFRAFWQDGIDISKVWGVYRQHYCGCVFSETERYAKKLERLKKNKISALQKS